jgi:hypothetical protein
MFVSICPTLFSPNHVFVKVSLDSDFSYLARRLNRTATLDGGAFIADNGYSPSDGTIKIVIDASHNSPVTADKLALILQQFGMVTVASKHGLFLAAFESITPSKNQLSVKFLIKSKLA